jgi:hypothetical protein
MTDLDTSTCHGAPYRENVCGREPEFIVGGDVVCSDHLVAAVRECPLVSVKAMGRSHRCEGAHLRLRKPRTRRLNTLLAWGRPGD